MSRVAVLLTNISEKVLEFMITFPVKPKDKIFEAYLDAVDTSKTSQVNLSLFLRFIKLALRKRVVPINQGDALSLLREEYSRRSNHSQLRIKNLC